MTNVWWVKEGSGEKEIDIRKIPGIKATTSGNWLDEEQWEG